MSHIRKKTIRGLTAGDRFIVSRQFTEEDMLVFADVTRDYNPVHFEKRFGQVKDFKGRICHGLLVGSILTEIGGQIGWLASEMNFRFTQPVSGAYYWCPPVHDGRLDLRAIKASG